MAAVITREAVATAARILATLLAPEWGLILGTLRHSIRSLCPVTCGPRDKVLRDLARVPACQSLLTSPFTCAINRTLVPAPIDSPNSTPALRQMPGLWGKDQHLTSRVRTERAVRPVRVEYPQGFRFKATGLE